MDNLVKLSLRGSGIEILPSSVGRYCTNLASLDLRYCDQLHSIKGNFGLLKHLKELHLDGCDQLKNIRTQGLFDVESCLQLLSLTLPVLKSLHRVSVNELLGFSRCLTRLYLAYGYMVDGDISSVLFEGLSNLEALDLSGNHFSRLHSSLSQLPRLKYLNLSACDKLVELPDLPSSIAVLIAEDCDSLISVGDFSTNHLKWLWKVSLSARKCNVERVLESMFKGNAIEYYFISIEFGVCYFPTGRVFARGTFTLQLPQNWYTEYAGFLVYIQNSGFESKKVIIIKDEMGRENEDDVLEVSNKTVEFSIIDAVWYISFGSLRNTSWWNSTHTTLSFFIRQESALKVELVPRKYQDVDSIERSKDTTYLSEFWDEEHPNKKTFEIISDSKSSIEIQWRSNNSHMFDVKDVYVPESLLESLFGRYY